MRLVASPENSTAPSLRPATFLTGLAVDAGGLPLKSSASLPRSPGFHYSSHALPWLNSVAQAVPIG